MQLIMNDKSYLSICMYYKGFYLINSFMKCEEKCLDFAFIFLIDLYEGISYNTNLIYKFFSVENYKDWLK